MTWDWSKPLTEPLSAPQTEAEWAACLSDPLWRICSGVLYKIMVKGDDQDDSEIGQLEPFLPNVNQIRFLQSLHFRNTILKARQLGFCLDPSTPVLMADLTWKPIGDVAAGQKVIAVDEQTRHGRGSARRMRTATVIGAARVHRMAYRIRMEDGRELICTDQHPWLARRLPGGKQPKWRSLTGSGNAVQGKLKVGDQIRWITSGTWDAPTAEDGWMGGMLDGEGSIAKTNVAAGINVSQRPGPVWDRLVRYAASRGYNYRIEDDSSPRPSKFGRTPVPKLCFGRMDEMFRLIGATRPTRFIENRFWEDRELPGKRNGGVGWTTISSIEPIGMQDMIDLQTSEGTYIANGFVSHNTTLAAIMATDRALFTPNQRCGIIADEKDKASAILRDKVMVAYDNLPEPLRIAMPVKKRTETELQFAHNNSSVRVAISMRGGTIHFLHISELGKIAAKYPAKAREVQTGSLPAVPATGIATIESTAEGAEGLFFDMTSRAEAQAVAQAPLNRGDYKFHFFPWFLEPGYRADPRHVRISPKQHEYFDKIEVEADTSLDMSQRAWYVTKLEADFSGDHQLMMQEMPSTSAEAWSRSTEGTFLTPQLTAARAAGRITKVPHVASLPVHTFWDIGNSDGTGIWMGQQVGLAMHMLRYIEDWGKGYAHFIQKIEATGFLLGDHYLPHDAAALRQGVSDPFSPLSMLQDLRPRWRFNIVPRVHDFTAGITVLKQRFHELWIDEEGCKEGLTHLTLYRKKFNSSTKSFQDVPEKYDGHSEAPDALRQWAQGFTPSHATGERKKPARRRSGLTA